MSLLSRAASIYLPKTNHNSCAPNVKRRMRRRDAANAIRAIVDQLANALIGKSIKSRAIISLDLGKRRAP